MEHIQEAIEKARSQRGHEKNTSSARPNTLLTQEKGSGWSTKGADSAISIDYSHTRVVRLSEEELKAKKIVAGLAHDIRSQPYRQLRSQLLKKMRTNHWRSLSITSPNEGNGKTLTAINLAISISKEVNQTVMLVDLDLKEPGIAKIFGLNNLKTGIVDTLNDDSLFEDILFNPGYERLVIAPGTPQGEHTSEILSSPAMRQLQKELYNRYQDRIIIYDLPAVLSSDDALVFAPNADATLLVVEDGGTDKKDLARSVELLQDANLIGSIINKLH